MSGSQVSQVEHKIIDGIVRLLERCCDRKALPVIEKAKQHAAPRRLTGFIDQSKLPPCECRRHIKLHCSALLAIFARIANFRIIPLRLWISQPISEFIKITLGAETIEAESRNRQFFSTNNIPELPAHLRRNQR